jgi:fructoselysine-6-P-deglycase FrlB-like protein
LRSAPWLDLIFVDDRNTDDTVRKMLATVAHLGDRVVLIDRGRVLAEGTVSGRVAAHAPANEPTLAGAWAPLLGEARARRQPSPPPRILYARPMASPFPATPIERSPPPESALQ